MNSEGAHGPGGRKGNTEVERKNSEHAKQYRAKWPTTQWKEETDERATYECTAVIQLNRCYVARAEPVERRCAGRKTEESHPSGECSCHEEPERDSFEEVVPEIPEEVACRHDVKVAQERVAQPNGSRLSCGADHRRRPPE